MSKHLIFVYGTLKRGWGNNAIIHDQKYIGVGTTSPDFEMFSLGGYPGVIEGDKRISGELWEIDDAAFARCDRLEGHPNFYKRWQVGIVSDSEDDKEVTAWIYIYQGDVSGLKPIDNWTR